MQQGSSTTSADQKSCAFCERAHFAPTILKETNNFHIVADHAPLVEGHILIIPKAHYRCYGDTPAKLDTELLTLKREVARFFQRYYAPVVFWEHGVFHQTVFHAHLHCFPFGDVTYDLSQNLHKHVVEDQNDIRAWFQHQGHYFYLEDAQHAMIFPPEPEPYMRIIQDVLRPGVVRRSHGHTQWRPVAQRIEEGKALIQATIARWHTFQKQEQEAGYAH
jgi:diadenosine tetraphosphate (Ap4A) HIT family hydrolase